MELLKKITFLMMVSVLLIRFLLFDIMISCIALCIYRCIYGGKDHYRNGENETRGFG